MRQTMKQRKALRLKEVKKPRRVRKQLGNDMSMLVERAWVEDPASPIDWVRVHEAMTNATPYREPKHGPREMIANDIETATLRCQRVRQEIEREFAAARPPSLWQRIKRWFA